jgi:hypothetical protein
MNLCYTTAFDAPGEQHQRLGAKLLVSSLLRTGFSGDIVVISNSECPVYFLDRKGVEEVVIDLDPASDASPAEAADAWRFLAGQHIDMARYERVLYAAPGTLALRNIDHLLWGRWKFAYSEVPGGNPGAHIDEGLFALGGEEFAGVASQLLPPESQSSGPGEGGSNAEPVTARPHSNGTTWSAFVGGAPSGARRLEPGEVCYPLAEGTAAAGVSKAAVLRADRGDWEVRLSFLFGQSLAKFFWEETGTLLNTLEP